MYILGYCYTGSECNGFRTTAMVHTEKEAKAEIQKILAGHKVTYVESNGKYRAYSDHSPTNYIYFKTKLETWVLINELEIGSGKCVEAKGELSYLKGLLAKKLTGKLSFQRNKDNISVFVEDTYVLPSDYTLIRVS